MTTSVEVRGKLIQLLRRDLFGPHPDEDIDLAREVLKGKDKPSRWYVGGFIAPASDGVPAAKDEEEESERAQEDLLASENLDEAIDTEADEQDTPDQPPKDNFLPSSIGLTVTLSESVQSIGFRATWGDYKTEPPLPDALVLPDEAAKGEKLPPRPGDLHWVRIPGEARLTLDVTKNIPGRPVPGSAASQKPGGGLEVSL